MIKRTLGLLALAFAATTGLGGNAYATFDYTTSLTILSTTGGATFSNTATGATATLGGTTVTLTDVSRTGFIVPSANTVNVGDVAVTTTTVPPTTESFTINYRDVFTLTNNGPPGTNATGSFPLTGTLTINSVNTGTGVVTNIYNSPTSASGVLGGILFTGAVDNFGFPTINGASGNFGGTITAAVPEPSSVALMGIGVVAAIGLAARRRMLNSRVA